MKALTQDEIRAIFEERKAILSGTHVVYTSGRHGSGYVNKDGVYPDTASISALCGAMAAAFADDAVDVVAAPAIGGVILSQWVAHHLSADRTVLAVYAEKTGDGFILRRGYDKLAEGKRVLVVEDIITTGGSVKKTVDAVRAAGGEVIGVAALCNRGGVSAEKLGDVPRFEPLMTVSLDSWAEEECPMCRDGLPIETSVGKGAEFLARRLEDGARL